MRDDLPFQRMEVTPPAAVHDESHVERRAFTAQGNAHPLPLTDQLADELRQLRTGERHIDERQLVFMLLTSLPPSVDQRQHRAF